MVSAIQSLMSRQLSITVLLIGVALCALPIVASAGVFKWVDENGKVHFGDQPPADAVQQEIKGTFSTYNAGPAPDLPAADTVKPAVIMYSTSWCPYCVKARNYFRANNVRFREYDIEKNSRANREYQKLGGNGVPLIRVGKQLLSGFSSDRFDRAYNN